MYGLQYLSDPACQILKSCRQDLTHVALPININPQAEFLFFHCIVNIVQHILSAFFIGLRRKNHCILKALACTSAIYYVGILCGRHLHYSPKACSDKRFLLSSLLFYSKNTRLIVLYWTGYTLGAVNSTAFANL